MSRSIHTVLLVGAALLGLSSPAGAADGPCATAPHGAAEASTLEGLPIASIEFEIRGMLETDALRRNLRLQEGDSFDSLQWRSDIQQLENRGVVDSIETRITSTPEGLCLLVEVDANWTLLPYLGLQTGAVPIVMVGAHDANLLGELVEVGGYYMRRGPHNLGRAWLVLPNVVAPETLLDIELVMTGELMLDYPSPAGIADDIADQYRNPERYRWTVPESGQEVLRRGAFVDFGYRVIPDWLTLAGRYVLLFESSFELPNIRSVLHAAHRGNDAPELRRGPERRTRLSLLALTAIVGHVDMIDNYRWAGHELRLVLVGAAAEIGSQRELAWAYVTSRHYLRVLGDFDLGARLTFAHSTSRDRRDHFNLGGCNLEPFVHNERNPGVMTIRGFRESSFSGPNILFANVEPRYDLAHDFELPLAGKVSLTLAAYVDAGYAWRHPSTAFDDLFLSAGAGVLISLQEFRYTFINWYYAHTFRPLPDDIFSIVLTRPFF